MGANKSRMSQYFTDEVVNKQLKDAKPLIESFRNYQNNNTIGPRAFSILIRKPSDPDFSLALFNIFKSRKEGLTFSDYKLFYLVFTTKEPRDKINFIAELLFEDNALITKEAYEAKTQSYFKQTKYEIVFNEEVFVKGMRLERFKENNTNSNAKGSNVNANAKDNKANNVAIAKEIVYSKEHFIVLSHKHFIDIYKMLTFLNPIQSAANVLLNPSSDNFQRVNYACPCKIKLKGDKANKEDEDILIAAYEEMKNAFDHITYRNDGTFPIMALKGYLDKVNVKEELQSIILTYLRNNTLRPFLDFITFKAFMLRCTKGTDDLCEFIFEMILYPAKEGSKESIETALHIIFDHQPMDNAQMQISDAVMYKEELGEFLLSLDSINILPFAFFNIKPLNLNQLNKVLEFIMMKLQWEDYLIERIDKENSFYVINNSFWYAIEPCMSQDTLPKIIDNKPLTPNGVFLTEATAKYKENFILLPESVYTYIRKWFEVDTEIVLTKKVINKDNSGNSNSNSSKDEVIDNKKPSKDIDHDKDIKIELSKVINKGDYLLISKGQFDYEIDLYPIQSDVYSFKKIYEYLEGKKNLKDKCRDCLSDIYQQGIQMQLERKKKDSKLYPMRMSFAEVKNNFKVFSPESIRLFAYYNNQLVRLTDESSTFRKENMKGYCVIIIDSLFKDDCYYYDVIHPPAKSKANAKTIKPSSTIEEKAFGNNNTDSSSSTSSAQGSTSSASSNVVIKEPPLPLGLANMGNTCYFNSVLQIFLNLPILNELFDNPKLAYFINKNNKYGQQGKFIRQYFSILSKRKIPDVSFKKYMNAVAALKKILGSINEQFNNFDQQDANEFLTLLLETFHEELNIKNKRQYLINPPQLNNTDDELSNLNFANSIRRGASFIDALFLFQLKSNLICAKCSSAKLVYETNYILDIPVMVDTMIEVEVELHRLPFELKVYYDKVNEQFKEYQLKNCDRSITENLSSYSDELDETNLTPENYYLSTRNTNVPISFKLKCDRTASAESLLKRIRLIKTLELEPPGENKVVNEDEESKLIKTTCNELTTLVIYRVNGTKVSMETPIDDCFPSEVKSCMVFEHLNTNGMNILIRSLSEGNKEVNDKDKAENKDKAEDKAENQDEDIVIGHNIDKDMINGNGISNFIDKNIKDVKVVNLVRHKTKAVNNKAQAFNAQRQKYSTPNDCLCVSDYLSYFNTKQEITTDFLINNNLHIEYIVDIEHFHISPNQMSPFGIFYLNQIRMKKEWLILNNLNIIKATTLYDIIWENNKRMLKSFRKEDTDLWWRNKAKSGPNSPQISLPKMCYPFILRSCIVEAQITKCSKCPWYSFCPGCFINPFTDTPLTIPSNTTIVVDWCNDLLQTEYVHSYVNLTYTFKPERIKVEGENVKKEHTLDDCFALFCDKEKLEDQIYCDKCLSHQYFIKNYDLCKPPPILIMSLKRFKFNQHSRYKIRTFINYPINDMVIKGEHYDLYGIINHYGSISGGHYTSMIKVNGDWLSFDDSRVSKVSERQILSENAYLLIYTSVKSPMDKSYYHRLYSILSNIEDKDIPNVIMDNCFFFGEPVKTPYGRGYCLETIEDDDDRVIVPIKFIFGQGFVNRKHVIKETVIEIKPREKEKEVDNDDDDDKDDGKQNNDNKDGNSKKKKSNNKSSSLGDCVLF